MAPSNEAVLSGPMMLLLYWYTANTSIRYVTVRPWGA